jgi:glycosyltransferase involved in cell wall biosynthesis
VQFDLVVPTIGRPSLAGLLEALDRGGPPLPERVLLVDDRSDAEGPLPLPPTSGDLASRIEVLSSGGRGPAGARNVGWRAATAPWVAFVDDDVVPAAGWPRALWRDLSEAPPRQAASQGRLIVPLPSDRRPTDWERNVARLEGAPWITADMAVRRDALERVGGFDERFRRAFREDADLAMRLRAAGYEVAFGERLVEHPVRPADRWVSVRLQEGNADDVLAWALHGRWQERARRGCRPWHVATVLSFVGALIAAGLRRPAVAGASAGAWLAMTLRFAWIRIAPGPRTRDEVVTMTLTSVAIPFAAVGWTLVGLARLRSRLADAERAPRPGRVDVDAPTGVAA